MAFDPDSAATSDSGLYGLPYSIDESRFVIVPVPFDATTSYRDGTRNGPAAVFEASRHVDLFDDYFRPPYEQGIAAVPLEDKTVPKIAHLNREPRQYAAPVIEAGATAEGGPHPE